jgi:hypothetical protein
VAEGGAQKVVVLKNHVNIRKTTIKMLKMDDGNFHMEFIFDSNYECEVIAYICAQECRNASNIPIYFYTNPNNPEPVSCKFSPGLKQKFPPNIININPSSYPKEDLTMYKDDYFPIVLSIETHYPSDYTGRAKKSI